MFIIFGYRVITKMLATLSYVCGSCGRLTGHHIHTRWRFFTLFFLPVIPLGRKHYRDLCVGCGQVSELSREAAEMIISEPTAPVGGDLELSQGPWGE